MFKKLIRMGALAIVDAVAVAVSWILTLVLLRLDLSICLRENYFFLIGGICWTFVVNLLLGLYLTLLKYANIRDAVKLLLFGALTLLYNAIVSWCSEEFIIGWAIMVTMFTIGIIGISRFFFRIIGFMVEAHHRAVARKSDMKRVLIIGGGSAGHSLIKELQDNANSKMIPVCVLDDSEVKVGRSINGVKVVGKISDVVYAVRKYAIDKIIIAIPSLDKKALHDVVALCKKTKRQVLTIPGIYQLADGTVSIKDIKEVNLLDLLGREQVKVNLDEILGYIENKVVLVTGGGGSIGSELCRQIATHSPKQLIILDVYENNAYEIEQELKRKLPELNLLTLIASVRDSGKVDDVFEKYRPQIVFHAAAHKHVPLMETSPNEAVKNNVCGTFNVADAAGRFGTEKFVLISTDKAVNPTNIMGATKRICEMIVQTINKKYETDYVAVRFGNVLGSNGSVIPLFTKQIAEGGPVTVTHKDIVRYFMTIPEAVSLVLQAGAYAKGGEIFVLNMGEPVRIYDLAVNIIKLSGLEPEKDIKIEITGLRPGEKLYEEMLMSEEGLDKTANDMIYIGKPLELDEHTLFDTIKEMKDLAYQETDVMKEVVHQLVPTYKIDKR
ncbi:MAG: polysaccharide biosynthesis protein [Clostridia bacterium]|nr:polysaccharide biosynthesis protein [Clostridia bacterium]